MEKILNYNEIFKFSLEKNKSFIYYFKIITFYYHLFTLLIVWLNNNAHGNVSCIKNKIQPKSFCKYFSDMSFKEDKYKKFDDFLCYSKFNNTEMYKSHIYEDLANEKINKTYYNYFYLIKITLLLILITENIILNIVNKNIRETNNKKTKIMYYILYHILCLITLIIIIFFMEFVYRNFFILYIYNIYVNGYSSTTCNFFPILVACNYFDYGPSGTQQIVNMLCILEQNNYYPKYLLIEKILLISSTLACIILIIYYIISIFLLKSLKNNNL